MNIKGYIYKYTYPNGKVYIGQTRTSVEQRWYEHVNNSKTKRRKNMICDAAINKYGADNIKIDVLEEIEVDEKNPTLLVEKLNELEKKYISEYDSTDISKGYNICCGGEKKPLEQMILDEKWYEYFEKDGWGDMIAYFKYILYECIKPKICETHEKLDKEERYVWYGYKFLDSSTNKETTFSGFYNRYKDEPYYYDIGDFEYNDDSSLAEPANKDEWVFGTDSRGVIHDAIENNWVEDIRQTIWRKVMKNKKKILNEYKLVSTSI